MKLIKNLSFTFCFATMILLCGCDLLKGEDEKIKDALVGRVYQDDYVDNESTKLKNIKGRVLQRRKILAGSYS